MRTRTFRSNLWPTVLVGAVVAGALAWAPAATALPAEPTPSPTTTGTPDDVGSVAIPKKDPVGDVI
ncbi:hypothetical protein ACFYXF_03750 [Streptomyces sp. NPDC002680]|uniref:hypothetical protein n=1 Tax=Streptomyces sp. NPDC002680 TaxID=3364659 RepID=UPI0036A50F66